MGRIKITIDAWTRLGVVELCPKLSLFKPCPISPLCQVSGGADQVCSGICR
jgi:hypothetical protein